MPETSPKYTSRGSFSGLGTESKGMTGTFSCASAGPAMRRANPTRRPRMFSSCVRSVFRPSTWPCGRRARRRFRPGKAKIAAAHDPQAGIRLDRLPQRGVRGVRPVATYQRRHDGSPSRGAGDGNRDLCATCQCGRQEPPTACAFFIDHCTRSAMNLAKGLIFKLTLALSSADRYGSRSSTRTTVHG